MYMHMCVLYMILNMWDTCCHHGISVLRDGTINDNLLQLFNVACPNAKTRAKIMRDKKLKKKPNRTQILINYLSKMFYLHYPRLLSNYYLIY